MGILASRAIVSGKYWLLIGGLCCSSWQLAWANPERGAELQQTWSRMSAGGTLARSAAALESQLDLYRRQTAILNDLLASLMETSQSKGTTAATPLPEEVHAALQTQMVAARSRLDLTHLPPLSRAHHVTYLVAWERLAQIEHFGQVLAPLRHMQQALQQTKVLGQWVVQLYQEERSTLGELSDPMNMLDGIDYALDEVGRAERHLLDLKGKNAPLMSQLSGFFRLEQALGNALDLIASADEQGLSLGSESPFSIQSMQVHLSALMKHVQQFDSNVALLRSVPVVRVEEMTAYVWQGEPDGLRTEVTWHPQAYSRQAARLLLQPSLVNYGNQWLGQQAVPLLASASGGQQQSALGQGTASPSAAVGQSQMHACVPKQSAQEQAEQLQPIAVPVYEGAFRQQGAWQNSWPEKFIVTAESVWGEQSKPTVLPVLELAKERQAPSAVWASARAPEPEDQMFYKDAEAIDVTWRAAPNSLSLQQLQQLGGRSNDLPVITGYRVLRRDGEQWQSLGIVPADVSHWIDRPPASAWGKPLAYAVEAIDRYGGTSRSQAPCGLSAEVRVDPADKLNWAKVGAGKDSVPKAFVAHQQQRFTEGEFGEREQQVLLQRFEELPAPEQQRLQQQFWQLLARQERQDWVETAPPWLSDEHKAAWVAKPPQVLHAAIAAEMKWSLWMADNVAHQQQVTSWWSWQTNAQKRAAVGHYWRQADGRRIKAAGWRLPDMAERGEDIPMAMVLWAYAREQDEGELAALDKWWQQLGSLQEQKITDWWQHWSLDEKSYLAWPPWHLWQADERAAWMANGYQRLPAKLQQQMLAWWSFSLMPEADQLATFRSEQTFWQQALLQLRYGLRPMDKALGFRLGWFLLMSTLLLMLLVWMQRVTLESGD